MDIGKEQPPRQVLRASTGSLPVDGPTDQAIAQLERSIEHARDCVLATQEIALGVPKQDDWRSAADFMEAVASILDKYGISRPEHYE